MYAIYRKKVIFSLCTYLQVERLSYTAHGMILMWLTKLMADCNLNQRFKEDIGNDAKTIVY